MKRYSALSCRPLILAAMLLFTTSAAVAGMLASSTRVIFQEGQARKTLLLANTNDYPVLVQVWVDDGETAAYQERINTRLWHFRRFLPLIRSHAAILR